MGTYLKTRDPAHIFNTMGLTVREPGHADAYRRSCYHTVAAAIGRDQAQPDDRIVLLGSPSLGVFHAVIARGDRLVTDALEADGNCYDSLTGIYNGRLGDHRERLPTLAQMRVADFIHDYVERKPSAPKP